MRGRGQHFSLSQQKKREEEELAELGEFDEDTLTEEEKKKLEPREGEDPRDTEMRRDLYMLEKYDNDLQRTHFKHVDENTNQTAFLSPLDVARIGEQAKIEALRDWQTKPVVELAPFLLHAKRDLSIMHEKLRPSIEEAEPEADDIAREARQQLISWGVPEPFLEEEVSTIEQGLIAMYSDFGATDDRTKLLAAQAFSIFLKYNPVAHDAPLPTRFNVMQEWADRLTALLPARAAPAAPKAWPDVVDALLGVLGDAALSRAFAAQIAARPPIASDTVVHWSQQPTFTLSLGGSLWMSIKFAHHYVIFADVDPATNLAANRPLLRSARAPLTPDWLVALKKVRWPASQTPPRNLE